MAAFYFFDIPMPYTVLQKYLVGERLAQGAVLFQDVFFHLAPFSSWLYELLYMITRGHTIALVWVSLLVSIPASLIFNELLNRTDAMKERGYLPLFLFFAFLLLSTDFQWLQASYLILILMLLSLSLFVNPGKKPDQNMIAVNSGLALGVAFLLDFSALGFILFTLTALLFLIGLSFRALLLHLFCIMLPSLLVSVVLRFWTGGFLLPEQWGLAWSEITLSRGLPSFSFNWFWVFVLVFLVSVIRTLFVIRLLHAQGRVNWLFIYWMLGCTGVLVLSPDFNPARWIYFIPAFTYFVSFDIIETKRAWLKELRLLLWLGLVFLCRFQPDENKTLAAYLSPERPTMLYLGKGQEVNWAGYKLGGSYLSEAYARHAFEGIDDPEKAIQVYGHIKADLPDQVQDRDSLFARAMVVFPDIQQKYKPMGKGIYQLEKTVH
jgi:hypothetical protein